MIWIGHVLRIENDRIPKITLDWKLPAGKRKRVRPIIKRRRTINRKDRNTTWNQAKSNPRTEHSEGNLRVILYRTETTKGKALSLKKLQM